MEFKILEKSVLYKTFSDMGKRIFQPNGIFYWAGRAKKEGDLNGTIGTAMGLETEFIEGGRDKIVPFYLPEIKDYINMEPERFVSYAPMAGLPSFRQKWKKWIIYKGVTDSNLPSGAIDLTGKLTEPIICNGITNAIFVVTRYFLNDGEVILSSEKRWGNYDSIITRQCGINMDNFTFFKDGAFNLEGMIEGMEKVAEKQNKVVLILNFPNNPTGYCPTQDEMKGIVNGIKEFVAKKNVPVVVLCDDAYEGYVYTDDRVKQSIFYELVGIDPLVVPIKMDGTSKEMLMYGARIGAITLGIHPKWYEGATIDEFKSEWDNKTKAIIRSTLSNSNHYSQEIVAEMLEKGIDKLVSSRKKVVDILTARYNKTLEVFNKLNSPNLVMDPAGGGFFVFINVEGIIATDFSEKLLVEYKLGTIPIVNETRGINGIRLAYCSIPEEKIEECFTRIDKCIREVSK